MNRGNFYMILHGDGVSSVKLRLNPEEAFFEPGRVYHFIAITGELGHVHSADLIWEYIANPINPLTWCQCYKTFFLHHRQRGPRS
jgi:hypothetical protein